MAKKYGIDFALKKDVSVQQPRHLVFFKGRGADVLTAAFKEFSAKNLDKEKKPSIRKLLSQMREKVKKHRQRKKRNLKTGGRSCEHKQEDHSPESPLCAVRMAV